jgi:cytoskeletal protein RodZ
MKSIKSSSIFTSNNSIPLIIFVFIFIGVGMFFLIQKTTEKQKIKQEQHDAAAAADADEPSSNNNNPEGKIIEETRNNNQTQTQTQSSKLFDVNPLSDNMTSPFNDEVGLFIKKDKSNTNIGPTAPIYIPPFGSGKETRCSERQITRPKSNKPIQGTASSDLVKNSSNASY